jgi:hypothetical protein
VGSDDPGRSLTWFPTVRKGVQIMATRNIAMMVTVFNLLAALIFMPPLGADDCNVNCGDGLWLGCHCFGQGNDCACWEGSGNSGCSCWNETGCAGGVDCPQLD